MKQVLLTSGRLKDQRNRWDSFLGLWERGNLMRSFLWNQEIADERALLTQFLTRLRRFFRVDFCFGALAFEGVKLLEVGLPEAGNERLPVNFACHCLDLIANSRVPIVWKQPHKPFNFSSTVISPLSPSIGQPLGFVMMGHSIPRSFASPELFFLQALAGELSWAIRDLRSKKNHRKLLATVSHELKNPIQVIIGHSALLQGDLAKTCSPQQREQLLNIETSARQLLNLVGGLVDAGGSPGGNLPVLEQPLDLIATLREIFAVYRKTADEKGLKFEAELGADLPNTIVTDPVKFRQIVRNLIDGVIHSSKDGEVEVVVKRAKGMLEIVAKEGEIEAAFESDRVPGEPSLRRPDLLRAKVRGGTGLGIVKELSNLLKGHVHVRSRPGKGSEFTVCLPCE